MRELATAERLRRFMRALGAAAPAPARVYLMGGATAVLHGWRLATIDADLWIVPDSDAILRRMAELKEQLRINVELVAPGQFLPELPGWPERSVFIVREGSLDFFHLDPYTQAFSKALRRQDKDLSDVREMIAAGLVDPKIAWELYAEIEGRLFRYPSFDPPSFRRAVAEVLGRQQ